MCPFTSGADVLRPLVNNRCYTVDHFLHHYQKKTAEYLIIDDVHLVTVLKFWQLLQVIRPKKIIVTADKYTFIKSSVIDVILKSNKPNIIFLDTPIRFQPNSCLMNNLQTKLFDKMDDSFHVIKCGSINNLIREVNSLKEKQDIVWLCETTWIRNKMNNELLIKADHKPIICRKNFYVGEKIIVYNGQLGFLKNNLMYFNNTAYESVEWEYAYALRLFDFVGRESDHVVWVHIGKPNVEMLYLASSRARKKFLLLVN